MSTAFLPKLLALGHSDHDELIARVQYLTVENQILRSKLPKRVPLTRRERRRLIRFGRGVGPGLRHLISVVRYTTFQRWLRDPDARRRGHRKKVGRPPTPGDLKTLVVQMARTPGWGYTRILGELRKLGIGSVSRTTIRSILKEHGLEPAPDRAQPTWRLFLERHAETLWSCDFFTKEVLTWRGIGRRTVLVFMHVASRKVLVTSPSIIRAATGCARSPSVSPSWRGGWGWSRRRSWCVTTT